MRGQIGGAAYSRHQLGVRALTFKESTTAPPLIITIPEDEWDILSRDRIDLLLTPALTNPHVVIDLSAVTYLDSTALNRLVMIHRTRETEPDIPPLRLVIASSNIRRLFKITDLDGIMRIYGTLEDALGE